MRYYGVLRKNQRRRTDRKDPHLFGFLDLGGTKLSVAGWSEKQTDGSVLIKLTAKRWTSRTTRLQHGELRRNDDTRLEDAPNLTGELRFDKSLYSLAAWINDDPMSGEKLLKLTAQRKGSLV